VGSPIATAYFADQMTSIRLSASKARRPGSLISEPISRIRANRTIPDIEFLYSDKKSDKYDI
jgi:hypothetical protein